ncbi:MAG: hypothetical protein ACREO3_08410 [Arenimonas sp.]
MNTQSHASRIAQAVARAQTPSDVSDLLDELATLHEAGAFHWENDDLASFLRGMSLATQMFEGEPTGDFRKIIDAGPWRTFAVVIAMGLALD